MPPEKPAKKPPRNTLLSLRTEAIDADGEEAHAILVGLDIEDADGADAFVAEVVEKVLLHRATAPPETAFLLVTILGPLTARAFARLWKKHAAASEPMKVVMSQMDGADVVHGTEEGEILDQASLLPRRR